MRRFWIEDENGERRGLNNEAGVWFDGPEGLGFSSGDEFYHVGGGVFAACGGADRTPESIVGDLLFLPGAMFEDGYSQYRQFVHWLLSAKNLTLLYSPGGSEDTAWQRAVIVASLSKSEEQAGALRCPVTFTPLEPWYFGSAFAQEMTADGSAALVINPTVDSEMDAAWRLEYTGGISYPKLYIYDADGVELGRCEIYYSSIASDDTLVIDSRPGAPGVWKEDANGVKTDLMKWVNLSYDPWPLLPPGIGTELRLTTNDTSIGTGTLRVFEVRRTI